MAQIDEESFTGDVFCILVDVFIVFNADFLKILSLFKNRCSKIVAAAIASPRFRIFWPRLNGQAWLA